jgi:CRISPR-associated protein Cas5d
LHVLRAQALPTDMSFKLLVSGRQACFPRPGFSSDEVTYDVMTGYHAAHIFKSVYARSELEWRSVRIHVLNRINFELISQDDTRILALSDVKYVIEAQFDMLKAGNEAQHTQMFMRAARRQTPFKPPFLGLEKFPATFRFIEKGESTPISIYSDTGATDLGWLPYRYDRLRGMQYWRATMLDGVINMPSSGVHQTDQSIYPEFKEIFD